ncbi:NACHT domain-containing protein [Streptomyces sp. NPDC054904]
MDQAPLARLATRLRTLWLQSGLTMSGLQHRSQLGRTTVSQALNGSRLPSEATVVALARALGADPDPLLDLHRQASPVKAERESRRPPQGVEQFEDRYRRFVADMHGKLTVVGLDLSHSDRGAWPLDAAYLSLELAQSADSWQPQGRGSNPSVVVRRAEQALAGQPRILLKGLAGSGKSTLLQWLAVAAATGTLPRELGDLHGRVPFVLPLRTLVRRGRLPQPQEFLDDIAAPLAHLQPDGWADSLLSSRALVLVDGVDEVPREQRQSTRLWLEQLLTAYRDMRVIVTSRPSAVPEGWLGPQGFTELTVQPMNSADTRIFISRWHAAARHGSFNDEERAHLHDLESTLQTTVRADRDLAQLSTTPLMCALICALHRERRGHLPHGRMELYAAALSMLLVRRDHERGIAMPEGMTMTEAQSARLLQRLAHWLIRNQQTEMERGTALALLNDALPAMPSVSAQGNAEMALDHLIGRTGLLRVPAVDTVEFVHRTFQDYLGAQAAIECRDKHLLINHAHDDQWEDVIRMAVAHARPDEAAELLSALIERGDQEEQNRPRLHLLAAASLHYATEIHPDIRELIEQRVSAWLPPRSTQEAERLAALGPGILELLPRTSEGLKSDEVSAVVRTAFSIGGDHGYGFLQQLATTLPGTALDIRPDYELNAGWEKFNALEYARDILLPQQTAQPDRHLAVRTREQLDALAVLPPLHRVSFHGPFSTEDIASHVSPEHVRVLQIHDAAEVDSLSFVRDLPNLQELVLSGCAQLRHINDLAGLPLPHLRLLQMPDTLTVEALAELPALKHLSLYTALSWRNLQQLEVHEELTELALGPSFSASVTGISRFPHLQNLIVNQPLDDVEWDEIASLPRLTQLGLGDNRLDTTPPMLSIKHLNLSTDRSDLAIDRIPECFPNLETLWLNCRNWTPDITPLRAIERLRISLVWGKGVNGLDAFPDNTVDLQPRPRSTPPSLSTPKNIRL